MAIRSELNLFEYTPGPDGIVPYFDVQSQALSVLEFPITGVTVNSHIPICEISNEKAFSEFSFLASGNNAALKIRIVAIKKHKFITAISTGTVAAGDETDLSGEITFSSSTGVWHNAFIVAKARKFHLSRFAKMLAEIKAGVSGKAHIEPGTYDYIIAAKVTANATVAPLYVNFKGTVVNTILPARK